MERLKAAPVALHKIGKTEAWRRIDALARRTWSDQDNADVVEIMTHELKTPSGTQTLRPIQAQALAEIKVMRGFFGPIGVGRGKTLISLLAATVLDAKNPLLLVPAQLKAKTLKDLPELKKHWKILDNIKILSYSELSLAKHAEALKNHAPDVIVSDECHYLKNKNAARTKRFRRFMKEHEKTIFAGMSGTVTRKSLLDYAHLVALALKNHAPVPTDYFELEDWSRVLDAEVRDGVSRPHPGALLEWCDESGADPFERARKGFRKRFVEAPGVVATAESELGVSLVVGKWDAGCSREKIDRHLKTLDLAWVAPNGDEIADALEKHQVARQVSMGFFYEWIWPNDEINHEWLAARKEWKAFVRETIKRNRSGLDSELLVSNACSRAELDQSAWLAWESVKGEYKPATRPVWFQPEFLVESVKKWVVKNEGIVWVEYQAVGELLSRELGLRFFGATKKDHEEILTYKQTCVGSIKAHSTGKNLQHFNKSLVVSCPASGLAWEQLLGRLHREGQEADGVFYDVLLHSEALEKSFQTAISDAKYIQQTTGNQQKLLYASVVVV